MSSTAFLDITKKEVLNSKDDRGDGDAQQKQKINFSLQEAITNSYNKMQKDACNDATKKIPDGFDQFSKSEQYKDLL